VHEIIENYDLDRISIATLGSHSALQILHGAKLEGFTTVLIVERRRLWFYNQFRHLIDHTLVVDSWREVVSKNIMNRLRSMNSILIPHGSFVEYVGLDRAESMEIPMFGLRGLLRIEADQRRKMKFLADAGIKIPKEYSINNVVPPVIVKFPGAKGGKGYFIANSIEDVKKGIERAIKQGIIQNPDEALIQEYIVGVPAYYHFFYSPVLDRLELLGADIRYESNVDGLKRLPAEISKYIDPSFVVVGNIPLVLRESLLPKIMDYGLKFVRKSKEDLPPGIIGPFCLESIIREDCEIIVFEFSGRIVAGTNIYIMGSPYSWLYWDEPMSTGRRIAREIRMAIDRGILDLILT